MYLTQESKKRKAQLEELNEIIETNASIIRNQDDLRRKNAKVLYNQLNF